MKVSLNAFAGILWNSKKQNNKFREHIPTINAWLKFIEINQWIHVSFVLSIEINIWKDSISITVWMHVYVQSYKVNIIIKSC